MFAISFVHGLVLVSACISFLGAYAYIRDTIAGRTKPNRVSWGMWALAPLIGTAAALSAGADPWATVRLFLAGFLPLLVFIASFANSKSEWTLTRFDLLCGAFSLAALLVWLGIDSPRIAILCAAIGDGFAVIPTLVKAWHHPETETGSAYIAALVSVLLVLPSIPEWTIENAAFQIYLLVGSVALLIAIYRKPVISWMSSL